MKDWVDNHPRIHLFRAWSWIAAVPVFIFLGWHESVFVVFLYSTYANFSGDRGIFEAAKARQESRLEAEAEAAPS